jgi:hypothetical protein
LAGCAPCWVTQSLDAPVAPLTSNVAGGPYATAHGLRLRHWPGEEAAVVYVPRTTSTHLVSDVAHAILALGAAQSITLADICAGLAPAMEEQPWAEAQEGDDTSQQLLQVAEGLVQAGLLTRAS